MKNLAIMICIGSGIIFSSGCSDPASATIGYFGAKETVGHAIGQINSDLEQRIKQVGSTAKDVAEALRIQGELLTYTMKDAFDSELGKTFDRLTEEQQKMFNSTYQIVNSIDDHVADNVDKIDTMQSQLGARIQSLAPWSRDDAILSKVQPQLILPPSKLGKFTVTVSGINLDHGNPTLRIAKRTISVASQLDTKISFSVSRDMFPAPASDSMTPVAISITVYDKSGSWMPWNWNKLTPRTIPITLQVLPTNLGVVTGLQKHDEDAPLEDVDSPGQLRPGETGTPGKEPLWFTEEGSESKQPSSAEYDAPPGYKLLPNSFYIRVIPIGCCNHCGADHYTTCDMQCPVATSTDQFVYGSCASYVPSGLRATLSGHFVGKQQKINKIPHNDALGPVDIDWDGARVPVDPLATEVHVDIKYFNKREGHLDGPGDTFFNTVSWAPKGDVLLALKPETLLLTKDGQGN